MEHGCKKITEKKEMEYEDNDGVKYFEEDFLCFSNSKQIAVLSNSNMDHKSYHQVFFDGFFKTVERLLKLKYVLLYSSGKYENSDLELMFVKNELIKYR